SRFIWRDIPSDQVINLLEIFRTHPNAPKVNSRLIAEFIRKKNTNGALIKWTVVLPIRGYGDETQMEPVGRIKQTKRAYMTTDSQKYSIRRLVNPADEATDLSAEELNWAKRETIEKWEKDDPKERGERPTGPSGFFIRQVRPA